MSKILITGGAGFIGSHTADLLLSRGHTVRILDILDPQIHGESAPFPGYLDPRVETIKGDVCDPADCRAALDGVEAVYHLAAQTGVGQSMYDMRGYVHTNCTGTATLLEAIVKERFPIRRLVLASSRAVYGEGSYRCPEHGEVFPPVRDRLAMEKGDFAVHCPQCGIITTSIPTAEIRPLAPISVYGWTKKHQEDLVRHAAETHGLSTVILRYFNVYGSRQSLKNPYTGVVTVFFNRILAGNPIHLYERGQPLRDFVHVGDVVQANLLALEKDLPTGATFNVGSGEETTITDIARALAKALGLEANLKQTGEFRVGDIFACMADMTASKALLGYLPEWGLIEGMREFSTWATQHTVEDNYQRTVDELTRHGLFGRATD
jgi:dTDP-L-rhamnose 4-epimerase